MLQMFRSQNRISKWTQKTTGLCWARERLQVRVTHPQLQEQLYQIRLDGSTLDPLRWVSVLQSTVTRTHDSNHGDCTQIPQQLRPQKTQNTWILIINVRRKRGGRVFIVIFDGDGDEDVDWNSIKSASRSPQLFSFTMKIYKDTRKHHPPPQTQTQTHSHTDKHTQRKKCLTRPRTSFPEGLWSIVWIHLSPWQPLSLYRLCPWEVFAFSNFTLCGYLHSVITIPSILIFPVQTMCPGYTHTHTHTHVHGHTRVFTPCVHRHIQKQTECVCVCVCERERGDRGRETDVNCHNYKFTSAHNRTQTHRS